MLDEHTAPPDFGFMPVIRLFGYGIRAYSLFMVLAFAAAFVCYKLTAGKLDKEAAGRRSLIVIYGLLGGIIGAKLPVLLFNLDLLFRYPENISLLISGKTIVGGLAGGFLAVTVLKRSLKIEQKTGNDIAAPAALGMAVGRIGCFFGGCCYGIESPGILGFDFGDGVFRYPTQLYEAAFDFGLFLFLLFLKKNRVLQPGILFRYLINAYLIFRFFIEFIRESDRLPFGLSYYQVICAGCLLVIHIRPVIRFITHRPKRRDLNGRQQ